jgi:hypothetical protein
MENKKLQTTTRIEQPVVSSKEDSDVIEVADIVRNVGRLIILKTGEQWTCIREPQDIDPDMNNF